MSHSPDISYSALTHFLVGKKNSKYIDEHLYRLFENICLFDSPEFFVNEVKTIC